MNLSLLPKRIKILCVSVLALLLSCEVQPTLSEKEIQQSILQDEDFVSMMADLFVMNYSEVTLDERDEHLSI